MAAPALSPAPHNTAAARPPLHTISLFVNNKPGVLVRTALVFSRRGFNIESLVVSAGAEGRFSRMTIVCSGIRAGSCRIAPAADGTQVHRAAASDVELARVQKWAAPTGQLRAYELYVRGRQAASRTTQDGSEAAVEFLSRAIEADPQFVAAQHALGVVHQNLGNRWKAAAQFRASAQLDPTYAAIPSNRAAFPYATSHRKSSAIGVVSMKRPALSASSNG